MARLTIEDQWWTDPRREKLAGLVGGMLMADAVAIRLWRSAQEFWGNGKKPMPLEVFETLEHSRSIVEAKLATVEGDLVYVRGTKEYQTWLAEKRQAAAAGGKKSATSRKKKYGTAQPNPEAPPKQNRSTVEANAKMPEPSGSGSVSDSEIQKNPSGSSAVALIPAQTPSGKFNPVALWCFLYHEHFGHSPEMLKEDAGKLTNFAKGRSEEKLRTLFCCYFQIAKQFYIDRGYPVGVFFADLQAINKAAETGVDPSKPPEAEWEKTARLEEEKRKGKNGTK